MTIDPLALLGAVICIAAGTLLGYVLFSPTESGKEVLKKQLGKVYFWQREKSQ